MNGGVSRLSASAKGQRGIQVATMSFADRGERKSIVFPEENADRGDSLFSRGRIKIPACFRCFFYESKSIVFVMLASFKTDFCEEIDCICDSSLLWKSIDSYFRI